MCVQNINDFTTLTAITTPGSTTDNGVDCESCFNHDISSTLSVTAITSAIIEGDEYVLSAIDASSDFKDCNFVSQDAYLSIAVFDGEELN